MKANLYQLEREFTAEALLAAEDLIRQTRDYTFETTSRNHFLLSSYQPDYQVEITQRAGGETVTTCQCLMFAKQDVCKHAIAALLILRSKKRKVPRESKIQKQDKMVSDLVKKLTREDLKSIVEKYAASHDAFRLEVLARNLYKLSNPDYFSLLQAAIPVNSKGVLDLQRKQVKIIRTLFSILLQQLQTDLKDLEVEHTVIVLEAVFPAIGKLLKPEVRYRESFFKDYRSFMEVFEKLCVLQMAPGLQDRLVKLSLDFTSRESYILISGKPPMLELVRNFTTLLKDRKDAVHIAIAKMQHRQEEQSIWGLYLVKIFQEWNDKTLQAELIQALTPGLPNLILHAYYNSAYKDVLILWEMADTNEIPENKNQQVLSAVFDSAIQTGRIEIAEQVANALIIIHHDLDKLAWLVENFPSDAKTIIERIATIFEPGEELQADKIIIQGCIGLEDFTQAWERMKKLETHEPIMMFDSNLPHSFRNEIINWYTNYISTLQSNYGGETVRQELHHIFGHLKSNGWDEKVKEKLKSKPAKSDNMEETSRIKGFIFDLDGVIVNSAMHHFEAWQTIMYRLGAEITEEDDHHTRGASRMESFEYLLNKYKIELSDDDKHKLAEEKNELYLQGISHITPNDLLPGVSNFINSAKEKGIKIALGSASKNARLVLKRLQVTEKFDAIVDGNDVEHSKPDPEVFIKAVKALNLTPEATIVFEDAAKGIQAAIAAGCHTIGLGDKSTLKNADLVLPGLENVSVEYILQQIQ